MTSRFEHMLFPVAAGFMLLMVTGCHQDMYEQQKYKTYTENHFFSDDLSARPIVGGTVVHDTLPNDELLNSGTVNGKVGNEFPFPVTAEVLARGRERFNIFCSPCHGELGDGHGMIVQRGFPAPPSYYTDTLRSRPVGYYFDVMTHGFGRMYSYAARIHPRDRWAIAAYIRALQLSQHAAVSELPESQRHHLEGR